MKICPACNAPFTSDTWHCPRCDHTPPMRGGYVALAPEPDPDDIRPGI